MSVVVAMVCGLLPQRAPAQGHRTGDRQPMQQALDDLKAGLDERWSYRHFNDADFDGAIGRLRKKVDAGISMDDFGVELQKIIALGIDGHARVSGYTLPGAGFLPFLVEPEGERLVAFNPERTAFLAEGFPYLIKIDGRDVADWRAAASALVAKGSPQYVRRHCLAHLRNLDYLRGVLELPKKKTVEVTLAGRSGEARRTLTLPVAESAPSFGVWPKGASRVLEGNIGYMRLPTMARETSLPEIRTWMPRFRETNGLIVDVRDNNGGERDALRLLYSYLAGPGNAPRVVNAAVYRLHRSHKEDHLAENHSMYRADATFWTDSERRVIADFAKGFNPEWQPPKGQFSEWHYLILRRLDDPEVYPYGKPVIVLMNDKCFSATDIFLAALKGMKNVTLLGIVSAGGSAYTQEVTLGTTPFRARLGSMVSFQSDGRLFDRNGVPPDVVVEPTPEYYIGGPDPQLAEAIKRITLAR
jgi:hypothetical protein